MAIIVFNVDDFLSQAPYLVSNSVVSIIDAIAKDSPVVIQSNLSINQISFGLFDNIRYIHQIVIVPNGTGTVYKYSDCDSKWIPFYHDIISDDDKIKIKDSIANAISHLSFKIPTSSGKRLSDCSSHMLFYVLGVNASTDERNKLTNDVEKLSEIKDKIRNFLPYGFKISEIDATTINIYKQTNELTGTKAILDYFKVNTTNVVYFSNLSKIVDSLRCTNSN